MADPVGALRVELSASAAQFEQDLQRARRATRDFASRAERDFNVASRAAAAFTTAIRTLLPVLAVGAVVNAIRNFAAFADEARKTAGALGITTEELTRMQYAAGQMGVKSNSLNNSLFDMQRRLQEAAEGTGEAKDALQALNIDAAKLKQLAPEKQFLVLVQALSEVNDSALRVKTAYDIFGGAGKDVLRIVDSGIENFEKLKTKADDLGIALDQGVANAAEAMHDEMDTANKSATGLAQWGMKRLYYSVAASAWAFSQLTGLLKQFSDYAFSKAAPNMEDVADRIRNASVRLGEAARNALDPRQTERTRSLARKEVKGLQEEILRLSAEYNMLAHFAGKGGDAVGESGAAAESAAELLKNLRTSWKSTNFADQFSGDTLEEYNTKLLETADDFGALNDRQLSAVEINKQLADTLAEQEAAAGWYDDIPDTMLSAEEAARRFANGIKSIEQANEQARQQSDAFARTVADGLIDGLAAGKNLIEIFRDVTKQLVIMTAKALVYRAIMQSLGFSVSPVAPVPTQAPAPVPPIPLAAEGARASARSPFIIGEEGPELFVPRVSGDIVPNGEYGGSGGGNVYINAPGADAGTVARIAGLFPAMRAQVMGDVASMLRESQQRGIR